MVYLVIQWWRKHKIVIFFQAGVASVCEIILKHESCSWTYTEIFVSMSATLTASMENTFRVRRAYLFVEKAEMYRQQATRKTKFLKTIVIQFLPQHFFL